MICPKHGGTWGDDDTCYLCGFHGPDEIVSVTILLHRDDVDLVTDALNRNDLTLLLTEEPFASVEAIVDAETEENEERGDIAMAVRETGGVAVADEIGGMTIEDARTAYEEYMGKPWVWEVGK